MSGRPIPSSSSGSARRRMASSTAVSFPPDQVADDDDHAVASPCESHTYLTSRDMLSADSAGPGDTSRDGSTGTLAKRMDPFGVPHLDEPDHIYVPVSTVVGRVYRRVPRAQALKLLAGVAEPDYEGILSHATGKNRTPLHLVMQARRIALGMVRIVPLVLLGMTAMESLLTCTQPVLSLGPLVQVYSPIARPLAIIFDALLTLLVTIRMVLIVTSTQSPLTIHPTSTPQASLSSPILFPPDINKPPRFPPSRLATLLYFVALVASATTLPFADDLDVGRNARVRGAGATWARTSSISRWLATGPWTNLPDGWSGHVLVWWMAGIVRMGAIAAGFLVDVVVKGRSRTAQLGYKLG